MEIEMSHPGPSSNGGGDVEKGGGGVVAGAAYLAWEDLTVVLPNFGNGPTKRLLNEITGYALPGRIMAVMGASGSGKSTFLDSLAGTPLRHPPHTLCICICMSQCMCWGGVFCLAIWSLLSHSLYPQKLQMKILNQHAVFLTYRQCAPFASLVVW